ncbi:HTH-type transcriptional regulator VirS [compost metagenome]|jgi:AraC-like DNA-binding protein|uniref:AraC family transcriptional regulator n=1 Tax=Pseudomonas chlororaphis TaxID=587753 RepID=UPI000FB3E139|nr:AraC family transcriptional regulator [Pseudomonas chlororaphis]QHC91630.1 AraC family transcriptional regulator [Pseudomonas chlororaphis]
MGQPLHRRVVPETYAQLLYEYLEARGHSPEAVLGKPWPEPNPYGLGGVDVDHWERMLECTEQYLADPLLSLHLGRTITARHLGILGLVVLACDNLATALQRLERYQRLIFDVVPMSRRVGPGWIELVWDISQYHTGRLVDETGFAVFMQFCRSLVRGPANLLAVEFTHATPADVRAYEEFFGCPVQFERPEPVIRISLDLLSSPLKSPDAALVLILEQHAEHLLSQLPQQEDVVEQVRRAISQLLLEGEPDIEKVSVKLRCSTRTLQRRLKSAGTGFRDELSLVRHELAASYLQDPRLQVVDVALLLGYSEHSAFTRAFKEWIGKTPQQVRDQSLQRRRVVERRS